MKLNKFDAEEKNGSLPEESKTGQDVSVYSYEPNTVRLTEISILKFLDAVKKNDHQLIALAQARRLACEESASDNGALGSGGFSSNALTR